MGRDKICSFNRGPSIDASYQVSLIWPCGFREDFKKSANKKQEMPVAAMFQFIWLRDFRGEDLNVKS
jgi:hypothetical protein